MPCTSPLTAYLSGYQTFHANDKPSRVLSFKPDEDDSHRQIQIPCGQCDSCRMEHARQWTMRCTHEAQMHEQNSFITLTYNDDNLPSDGSLHHEHFQLFLKRLRKKLQPHKIRYYMAGEYGDDFSRPHFHAIIFGYAFNDKKLWKRTPAGSMLYRSEELEALWPFGYSSVGDANWDSIGYVTRYVLKKVKGKQAEAHYQDVDFTTGDIIQRKPEYAKMSLKPGIGTSWLKKYKSDVYPHDYVVFNEKQVKPPKFYDKQYNKENPYEFDEIQYEREKSAKLKISDNTPERLAVKAKVVKARLKKLKRTLT